MRKTLLLCIAVFIAGTAQSQFKYPPTAKQEQKDTYFGTEISDPYRWLEDDRSAETGQWVKEQNIVTENYLKTIPFRDNLKKRLTQLWNFPKSASPFKAGKNYFVYTNNGLQNQFVLNILRGSISAKPEVFLDPNTMSSDGTTNIGTISVSNDGKYMAYAFSKAGSDWQEINIKNTIDGGMLTDKVEWVKFSGIAWRAGGFFYSRYDKPDEKNVLKGQNEFQKIYFHIAGTPQSVDQLIYEDKAHPQRNFGAGTTDDEKWLIISGSEGTSGNNVIVKDLETPDTKFVTLVSDFEYDNAVVDNEGSNFFILTNKDASRYKLISVDAKNPAAPPVVIIPESKDVLISVSAGKNFLIAQYMHNATGLLKVFSRKGEFLYDIPLASIGAVDQITASKKDSKMFYSLDSYTAPSTIYQFDLDSKLQTVFFKPKMDLNLDEYETKQVFYPSKDGTSISMFIFHKKGIQLNGNNPTMIFGYGGFNIPMTPQFKIERMLFLENGGIYAIANLRGGGEYGEEWHEAGTKLKKQNTFDDCIAAAEYLIKEKYTNPSKLALSGRSNGGLLVGAVMTQRPDLFKVAIPTVGVLDMLRYHKFTIGWAWKSDYGSSEDEPNFKNLLSFSPLHNIKERTNYPATLVITGDHDDRVVPAHSFKFIATLQEKYKGDNPVMVRIDVNSGHASTTALGSSKPVSKQIDEQTDIFSFLMYNLGMTVK
ncbi:MAG: S9 family peptidase [Bacteroidetes bacterium]|nr:S9 family peptidase [Bacteroidota bacterium]MBK9412643.1 S9 family peptidase [Bacteroidota bacterium]